MNSNADQVILDVIKKYGNETPFWRFVENFKNTVDFEEINGNQTKQASLLSECARQYEYLRSEHPRYFHDLTERKGNELTVLAGIVDWAVVKNIPMTHFSGINTKDFAAKIHAKHMEYGGEFPIVAEQTMTEKPGDELKQGEPEETVVHPVEIVPVTGDQEDFVSETPAEDVPATYTMDALIEQAVKNYEAKLGHVIRVCEYRNGSEYFHGSKRAENGMAYELALVMEIEKNEIVIENHDYEEMPYVTGTWKLKLLTGPLAEKTVFASSPTLYANGTIGSDIVTTGNTIKDMAYSPLSHEDLVTLAWRDAKRISEQEVYIKSCCGYLGDSDEQAYISLHPPALVKIDTISIEEFRLNSERPRYEIRGNTKNNDVIDWDCDFSSDDPRLKSYRSMWAGPPSYYQDGKVEGNDIVVGYDPANDINEEPTIFSMR